MFHHLLAGRAGGFTVVSGPWHGAVVRRSSNQTISNDTFDVVNFDTEILDTDGFWTVGTPYRFTVPSSLNGQWFAAGGHLRYKSDQNSHSGVRNLSIYLNATVAAGVLDPATADTTYADDERKNTELTGAYTLITVSGPPMQLFTGDYLDMVAYMFISGGGTLDIESSGVYTPLFWIVCLGNNA